MYRRSMLARARRALGLLIVMLSLVTSFASCGGAEQRAEDRARIEQRVRRIVRAETHTELARFASDAELREYAERMTEAMRLGQSQYPGDGLMEMEAEATTTAAAPPAAAGDRGESITNNQVAGVDEGGIVKVHGDHLVILRRGRLFTVRVGDSALRPVSMIDAFPEGAAGGWYDEMLVHDDTIVVVGYNYHEGGTELGLFEIDAEGALRRRGTHYLRSNDYYSSRNYASRLLGDRLVFYMPYYLLSGTNGDYTLPAVRARGSQGWDEVIRASQIYRPVQSALSPALHTVVSCDLSRPELACSAQGIVGPAGRSFFVSESAVYVWVGGEQWTDEDGDDTERADATPNAVVYRLPFDGSAPGAVRVAGMPTDQLSFEERDGHLNVLVRAEALGDWMWAPEVSAGDIALARIPLAMFSDGLTTAGRERYVRLPRVSGGGWAFQNRFANGYVLYGTGGGWGSPSENASGQVIVHHVDRGATSALALPHVVDRIEVMGADAVVVGAGGGDLHFSTVALAGNDPGVASHYAQRGASQGETRTHGFFYRPTSETGGMLGLPIRGGSESGWRHLVEGSAGVLYLRVENRQLTPIGALGSSGTEVNDRCRASCVDWYGNARPIFLRGRVFALLGYELVEGRMEGASIREVARTNFYADRADR